MIGGLFKSASVASIAAAGLMLGGISAQAADLGGNCCADLEERVAELEATTARKGNRKVSLEVSGHVNEAVIYWDDGVDDDIYQVTNVQSRTRFRFKGSAKINADWSAGFLIEIGMTRPGSSLNYDSGRAGANNDDTVLAGVGMDVRHQAMYVKSNSIGTVWLGHTSDSTDGITQICLGCDMGNYHAVAWGDIVGALQFHDAAGNDLGAAAGFALSAEGGRTSLVKYVSPSLAGFSLSAHWADEEVPAGDDWGAALRYAGEFGAIRVAAGIGYSVSDTDGVEHTEIGGSISMAHTPTGLYIAGSYGEEDDEGIVGDNRDVMWAISAGIRQKFNAMGATHLGGYYGNFDLTQGGATQGDIDAWGVSLTQTIDAAALDLYLQYHNIGGDVGGVAAQDINLFMAGARIKF